MQGVGIKDYLEEKAGVTEEQFKIVEPMLARKKVKKGEFLLQVGEKNGSSYFVEKGLLRMYSIDKNGKEHIIQFAPENWFIVERFSVFYEQNSAYFIDAIEDSEIVKIDTNFMCALADINKVFSQYNDRILQIHIMKLQKRITLLIGATAEERYLDFIEEYPDLMSRVPQWMIASYLGITPESLSRVRKELSKKKIN